LTEQRIFTSHLALPAELGDSIRFTVALLAGYVALAHSNRPLI